MMCYLNAGNTAEQQPVLSSVQKQELHQPNELSWTLISTVQLEIVSECSCYDPRSSGEVSDTFHLIPFHHKEWQKKQ